MLRATTFVIVHDKRIHTRLHALRDMCVLAFKKHLSRRTRMMRTHETDSRSISQAAPGKVHVQQRVLDLLCGDPFSLSTDHRESEATCESRIGVSEGERDLAEAINDSLSQQMAGWNVLETRMHDACTRSFMLEREKDMGERRGFRARIQKEANRVRRRSFLHVYS